METRESSNDRLQEKSPGITDDAVVALWQALGLAKVVGGAAFGALKGTGTNDNEFFVSDNSADKPNDKQPNSAEEWRIVPQEGMQKVDNSPGWIVYATDPSAVYKRKAMSLGVGAGRVAAAGNEGCIAVVQDGFAVIQGKLDGQVSDRGTLIAKDKCKVFATSMSRVIADNDVVVHESQSPGGMVQGCGHSQIRACAAGSIYADDHTHVVAERTFSGRIEAGGDSSVEAWSGTVRAKDRATVDVKAKKAEVEGLGESTLSIDSRAWDGEVSARERSRVLYLSGEGTVNLYDQSRCEVRAGALARVRAEGKAWVRLMEMTQAQVTLAGNAQAEMSGGTVWATENSRVDVRTDARSTDVIAKDKSLVVNRGQCRARLEGDAKAYNWGSGAFKVKDQARLVTAGKGTAVEAQDWATVLHCKGDVITADGNAFVTTTEHATGPVFAKENASVEHHGPGKVSVDGEARVIAKPDSKGDIHAMGKAKVVHEGPQVVTASKETTVWNTGSGKVRASDQCTVIQSGKGVTEADGKSLVITSGGTVVAGGEATVIASGAGTIKASGNVTVLLTENFTGRVEASGKVYIKAKGAGKIYANDDVRVDHEGHTQVTAEGARETAEVHATGRAAVHASGSVHVVADGEAKVFAEGHCEVTASGEAQINARQFAEVHRKGLSTVWAEGRATVYVESGGDSARIKLYSDARVIEYRGTVVREGGGKVRPNRTVWQPSDWRSFAPEDFDPPQPPPPIIPDLPPTPPPPSEPPQVETGTIDPSEAPALAPSLVLFKPGDKESKSRKITPKERELLQKCERAVKEARGSAELPVELFSHNGKYSMRFALKSQSAAGEQRYGEVILPLPKDGERLKVDDVTLLMEKDGAAKVVPLSEHEHLQEVFETLFQHPDLHTLSPGEMALAVVRAVGAGTGPELGNEAVNGQVTRPKMSELEMKQERRELHHKVARAGADLDTARYSEELRQLEEIPTSREALAELCRLQLPDHVSTKVQEDFKVFQNELLRKVRESTPQQITRLLSEQKAKAYRQIWKNGELDIAGRKITRMDRNRSPGEVEALGGVTTVVFAALTLYFILRESQSEGKANVLNFD